MKTVVVLGASSNPERYSFLAMQRLLECGHHAVPVNPTLAEVLGKHCFARISDVREPIHTVTVYLSAERSTPLIGEILAANPKRLILNPGAENPNLESAASESGIEVVRGCTLVMLQSGAI